MIRVCGVDEAGRGPLAGAVFAAAVILDPNQPIEGLADSKQLSERKRERFSIEIRAKALAWSIATASAMEIDSMNILQATMLAMSRAVEGLRIAPHEILVDGNRCPDWHWTSRAIIGGDACEPCISAASILAKTARDAEMRELHLRYPNYGFDRHKGYPTLEHIRALEKYGVCPAHRTSYAPVRRISIAQERCK